MYARHIAASKTCTDGDGGCRQLRQASGRIDSMQPGGLICGHLPGLGLVGLSRGSKQLKQLSSHAFSTCHSMALLPCDSLPCLAAYGPHHGVALDMQVSEALGLAVASPQSIRHSCASTLGGGLTTVPACRNWRDAPSIYGHLGMCDMPRP